MLKVKEQIRLAHTYALLGQIQGLLEAWLGQIEPPIAEIFDRGDWDRLTRRQQNRILQLFDEIPSQHVSEAIQHAKQAELRSGIPMFEHGGSYWPVFFYHLMIANIEGKNARAVLPQVLNPGKNSPMFRYNGR
jgi:hypothetical protein